MSILHPLAEDLDHILKETLDLWTEIYGKRLFITGGTGFFGKWILESFIWVKENLNLDSEITVLTRDFEKFKREMPHIACHPSVRFIIGDVRNFSYPDGDFQYILHLASASAIGKYLGEDPLQRFDTIVQGTRRVLDFAVRCGCKKLLFTSSGYVYGSHSVSRVSEEQPACVSPFDSNAPLGVGKLAAEFLCQEYSNKYGFQVKIARCFSFVGPYLQLNIHYAVGNFIRDLLMGGPICVESDGSAIRSYMYTSDLTIWLWNIFFKGKTCYPYNVGSEDAVTIKELANTVAQFSNDQIKVKIKNPPDPGKKPHIYVPSTKRARMEMGLKQSVGLVDAIRKTVNFYRKCGSCIKEANF